MAYGVGEYMCACSEWCMWCVYFMCVCVVKCVGVCVCGIWCVAVCVYVYVVNGVGMCVCVCARMHSVCDMNVLGCNQK